MRIWRNQLIVKVRERRPVAFAKLPVGTSGQFHYLLIDAEGVLLTVPRQRFDFPVLTGVTEDQGEEDRRVRVLSMRRLLRDLGTQASVSISEVNAASPQDMRVSAKINGHPVELWLGDRQFCESELYEPFRRNTAEVGGKLVFRPQAGRSNHDSTLVRVQAAAYERRTRITDRRNLRSDEEQTVLRCRHYSRRFPNQVRVVCRGRVAGAFSGSGSN